MLHWLAGNRPSDDGFDPDATAITEGPETPAPVFAVRAFKHAIFGTPQTQQPPKPRRHSATESPLSQVQDIKSARPAMIRPKSWHDAQCVGKSEDSAAPEPLPSPTKGILVTPGTAGTRRKTVSFGDQVIANETKRAPKSGLPDDCPGKFPSPWVKADGDNLGEGAEEANGKSKGRNKLTEALEQAREDSAKRKTRVDRPSKSQDEAISAFNPSELYSDSARYWKQEYDIYRENTTREVKKLVAKQKAAKNFARDKDIECAELKEQLRLEQKKVVLLEKRTAELEAQLREFQDKLQKSHVEEHHAKQEIGQLRRQNSSLGATRPTFAEQIDSTRGERRERRTLTRPRSVVLQSSSNVQSHTQPDEDVSHASGHETGPLPPQDRSDKTRATTHHKTMSSSRQEDHGPPSAMGSTVSQIGAPLTGRRPASKPAVQPLKDVKPDVVPLDTRSVALSMGLQPPSPVREPRRDSPMHSPDLARTSSDDQPIKASEQTLEDPKFHGSELASSSHSSGLSALDTASQIPLTNRSALPVAVDAAGLTTTMRSVDMKENITPMFKLQDLVSKDADVKPSAAWHGLSARSTNAGASGGRRIVGKDGQEVGADRIAAAQARILARGRQVS